MAELEVHVRETEVPGEHGARYVVFIETLSAFDIPPEVFLYRTVDEMFSHVATVFDVNTYPAAPIPNFTDPGFYRQRSVTREFGTKPQAAEFSQFTQFRIKKLVRDWQGDAAVAFGEDVIVTYEGTP